MISRIQENNILLATRRDGISRDAMELPRDTEQPIANASVRRKLCDKSSVGNTAAVQVLRIDDRRKLIFLGDVALRLSHKEYDLLCLLATDSGRVFSSRDIIKVLWPNHERASRNDVAQLIYLLRRRIETDPHRPRMIETVKGYGYCLAIPVAS